MPTLQAPGAEIYYETVGTGPLFLCVSGANGDARIWKPLSIELKKDFTVVSYDRRGFSHSHLTGPQDYSQRLETDTDDIKALINHLSPDEPATVIGNSSGAIVALMLLQRHPEVVKTLISHEPPVFSVLPNFNNLKAQQQEMYDVYRASGPYPALLKFAEIVKAGTHTEQFMRLFTNRVDPYVAGNVLYWFEREILTYPNQTHDLKDLKAKRGKLLLANGTESPKDAPQYQANEEFGKGLGLEVFIFSGAHTGFATHAPQFANELRKHLQERPSRV